MPTIITTNNMMAEKPAGGSRLEQQKPMLYGLLFMQFACYVPISLAAPFFPSYAASLGIDETTIGVIFGIYPVASLVAGISTVFFLPMLGRLKVLTLGGFLTCIGTLAFCFGESASFFIGARVAQGVGSGFVSAACSALTCSAFDEQDLAFVYALFEAIVGIGYALGPAIGSMLYSIGGFQLPFLVSVGMCFIMTLISPPMVRRYLKKIEISEMLEKENEKNERSAYDYENGLTPIDEVDEEEEEEVPMMTSMKNLFCKMFNTGFALATLNIILNSSVWAILEPLLESHFNKYMTLSDFAMGQLFLWPSLLYSAWTLGFVAFCRRYHLFRSNIYNIMGFGHILAGVGLVLFGPYPLFFLEKDSVWVWFTQIAGLLLINLGIGIGAVPSIPAMKRSVNDQSNLFDDVIGSLDCIVISFGTAVGPVAGEYFSSIYGFEHVVPFYGIFLIIISVPFFIYHVLDGNCFKPIIIEDYFENIIEKSDISNPLISKREAKRTSSLPRLTDYDKLFTEKKFTPKHNPKLGNAYISDALEDMIEESSVIPVSRGQFTFSPAMLRRTISF